MQLIPYQTSNHGQLAPVGPAVPAEPGTLFMQAYASTKKRSWRLYINERTACQQNSSLSSFQRMKKQTSAVPECLLPFLPLPLRSHERSLSRIFRHRLIQNRCQRLNCPSKSPATLDYTKAVKGTKTPVLSQHQILLE